MIHGEFTESPGLWQRSVTPDLVCISLPEKLSQDGNSHPRLYPWFALDIPWHYSFSSKVRLWSIRAQTPTFHSTNCLRKTFTLSDGTNQNEDSPRWVRKLPPKETRCFDTRTLLWNKSEETLRRDKRVSLAPKRALLLWTLISCSETVLI